MWVITGAANGIGRATAKQCLERCAQHAPSYDRSTIVRRSRTTIKKKNACGHTGRRRVQLLDFSAGMPWHRVLTRDVRKVSFAVRLAEDAPCSWRTWTLRRLTRRSRRLGCLRLSGYERRLPGLNRYALPLPLSAAGHWSCPADNSY